MWGQRKKRERKKLRTTPFPIRRQLSFSTHVPFPSPAYAIRPAGFRVEHGLEDNEALRLVRKEVRTVPGSVLRTCRFVVKCRGCVCFLT